MIEYLSNPEFLFEKAQISDSQLPDGSPAKKIVSKDKVGIVYTGTDGVISGVQFTKDKILVIPVYFKEFHSIYFDLRFFENYGKVNSVNAKPSMGVMPGFTVNIIYELKSLDLSTLFLPRTPGRLKNTSTGTPVKPEAVDAFMFVIPPSATEYTVFMGTPYLTDAMPECTIPISCEPQVDKLGQWAIKEWNGKTKNEDEMIANYIKWSEESPVEDDGKKSAYGGDLSVNVGGKGYFSTAVYKDKHYLVDPDGYLFYSIGVDCVNANSSGPVSGLEDLIEELPPKDGKYAAAWNKSRRNENSYDFNFSTRNLIAAFGDSWYEEWSKLTAKRLKNWHFNTIANWSDREFYKNSKIPYVIETPFPHTGINLFRDFPDVFSPEYADSAAKCAEFLDKYKDDKFLIGYFLRNEPNFAFGAYNLAKFMLSMENDTYSRREFISDMKVKYSKDINEFNKGWGTDFKSFDDLLKPFTGQLTEEADDCLKAFNKKLINQYIKVPSLACRSVDPNHMNLGLRWAWIASDDFYEGSEWIDVFSINCYNKAPDPEQIARVSKMSGGKPVIIGEFHAGALDVGLPANALQGVTNQCERGYFYSYYVENSAVIPELVGVHYFQYNDQPVLGRFDGENLNIGFIDVCGKPYYDMIEKVIDTNSNIYEIRKGNKSPTDRKAVEAPREGF